MPHEWRRGDYLISTDAARLNLEVVHTFLRHSYWAADIPLEVVKRSIEHSLSFGLYHACHENPTAGQQTSCSHLGIIKGLR